MNTKSIFAGKMSIQDIESIAAIATIVCLVAYTLLF